MAENEMLDLGHPNRWRRSRLLLDDPLTTVSELTTTAGEEFTEVVRRLAVALRKGQPLVMLLRAANQSAVALQSVIAEFTEKRLASLVVSARQTASDLSIEAVAHSASTSLIQTVVDQIVVRALSKSRFTSPQEQARLRKSLTSEFGQHQSAIRTVLEASMRGAPIKPIRTRRHASRPTAHQVAATSLVITRPEAGHAYR
jgi:hypothetical protein